MISTFFEPIYAREAIPVLDEPCFKSIYNLTVTVPVGWTVLSNMPGTSTATADLVTTVFQPTPPMPSYLLHWTVLRHNKISACLGTTSLSLYAQDTTHCSPFLDLARESLGYYNDLFGIPYALPKLDLISVFSKSLLRYGGRRHGELGGYHLCEHFSGKQAWRGFWDFLLQLQTGVSRDLAYVVWKSGDHGVVERFVAE